MLTDMEKIISVTDLVRNASRIADEIEGGTIYRITRGGRGSMVLVDEEYFEGWMAAIEEMRRPDWQEVLAETRRDVAARRGKTLDAVLKERDLADSSHSKGRKTVRGPTRTSGKKSRQGVARTRSRSA